MAISYLGTTVAVSTAKLPKDYVLPTVAVFTDWERLSKRLQLLVTKSVVQDADPEVTITNILAEIETQILALVTPDYIASQTVSVFGVLFDLSTNFQSELGANDWLTDTVVSYICEIRYYIKAV